MRTVLRGLPPPKTKRTNALYAPRVRPNTYSARGWEDYLAENPYPKEYDTWPEIAQRHYERGRLRAAGAPLIYRRVPAQEPRDIVERTNGLRLVPPSARRIKR